MSVVFLSLLLIFELIQQDALVNFVLFLNIFRILKIPFLTFWGKYCISLALWALFSLKLYKAFRIGQCKQLQLVKLWLNFDLNFIFKSFSTALLETVFPTNLILV